VSRKQVHFRSAARDHVLRGASALADAVRVTLGPRSKCVLIGRKYGRPLVCNDGVTIAREFELADPEQNLGVQMMREAAQRTGDAVGDGTSTATLLAHAVFAEGLRNVAAGASAVELKHGLDRGVQLAVAALRGQSRPVQTRHERAQVATIAAHNEAGMGELVADAVERVGPEGAITVEEAQATETSLEVTQGMQFDRGYLSPYFVSDTAKMEAVLDDARVLLTGRRITVVQELVPLLEQVVQAHGALLVVAEEVDTEALATLVLNKLRGALPCVAVKAPGFGDRRRDMLQDLAILTGGVVVGDETGTRLEDVQLAQLGRARRVVVNKDATTVVGGVGDPAAVAERCNQLRLQIKDARYELERDKLKERLARLAGGVAVIRVGAPSETELKNRKEAFEDAIAATKAATAEGTVPGGGVALLRCVQAVAAAAAQTTGDERTGLAILQHALEAPARQIAENSGMDGAVVVERVRQGSGAFGFDAQTGEFGDLVARGILDPTQVVRVALENAVSVASVLLLTEATLTEVDEPSPEPPSAGFGEGAP
jgi:chaperonin GroEL